ncbi:MAG: hypothetical protein HY907_03970 [Deltaproteobacteria bacterium]|nr:hypothetical protein [Deltaproteobacteria bacterium]
MAAVALGSPACGGSGGDNQGTCGSDLDCPGGHCIDGRCVGNDAGGEIPPTDGEESGDEGGADLPPVDDGAGADGDEDGDAPDETPGETDADADADDDAAADGDEDTDGDEDGDASDVPSCVDGDGDLHGSGCAGGPDCDDADPLHWNDCADCATTHAPGCACAPSEGYECYSGPAGTQDVGACAVGSRWCVGGTLAEDCEGEVLPAAFETCGDGIDNDCNGAGDEEVFGPCGTCDVTCRSDGEIEPSSGDPGSSGLMSNPDGPGVTLGAEDVRAGFLWAANDPDGSVSKLDLATGAEVARYRVGLWGNNCDSPSRTAVDGLGNAYVGARAHVGCAGRSQGSVTKMAGDLRYCVDRNGDTTITTSTGPGALALGDDECVIWRVPVGGAGGTPRALAIDLGDEAHPEGHPWIGLFSEMRAYQLDPDTGAVLNTVGLNVNTYGFAISSDGWIWASGRGPSPLIQRFHTTTLAVEPAIAIGTCGNQYPYGITVDIRNRVWAGIWLDGNCCAARYDPADGSWFGVNTRPGWGGIRGIAADADGTIWASIHQNWGGGAIASFHMDDGSGLVVRDIAGVIPVGVGVDEIGHVWTVNQSSSNVTRLTTATGALEQFPVGPNPYTYSDFTGYQRRLMIPRGSWTRDYERCAVDSFDRWGMLEWDADVPAGASLTIAGASADTAAGLDAATPVVLAVVPPDAPPVDLEAAFAGAAVTLSRFLRVTVTLEASPDRTSPVFRTINVQWHCYRMP